MISKLVFALMIMISSVSYATTEAIISESECNSKLQGIDIFPWSTNVKPLPFPWDDIQGIWRLSTDSSVYLKARVINSTKQRKILNLSIVSTDRCNKPIATGTGFIDFSEKNVVRAVLSDGMYRYQLKLGKFESADLKIDSRVCGDKFFAASVKIIGTTPKLGFYYETESGSQTHNMMLKKVSDDINSICKKGAELK